MRSCPDSQILYLFDGTRTNSVMVGPLSKFLCDACDLHVHLFHAALSCDPG
jgi:hypothetical protein